MITLPGDITSERAGPLLRRGAPVRNRSWRDERADVTTGDPYPYTELGTTELVCATAEDPGGVSLTLLALDLSDGLGMDIAARWLARHHGLTVGATAPDWRRFRMGLPDGTESWAWALLGTPGEQFFFTSGNVPGISAETDPAAALRLAILAAAGRTEHANPAGSQTGAVASPESAGDDGTRAPAEHTQDGESGGGRVGGPDASGGASGVGVLTNCDSCRHDHQRGAERDCLHRTEDDDLDLAVEEWIGDNCAHGGAPNPGATGCPGWAKREG